MATELDMWWVHTVSVQPLLGQGGTGPAHGDPVTVECMVEDKRRLVRDATGAEVVSETTIYAPPDAVNTFLVGSLVTLPRGRVATVLVCAQFDSGGLDLPDHVQVALT